jgi:cyclopropane fatty-acyl-phospholipid synthase-like methyltransferase
MFRELEEITRRPPLFSHYTTPELWTDEHISEKMLEYHLNESVDICSRRTEFIERSVQWIVSEFELDETKSVADFGCGPGLYTTRLALSGAEITGSISPSDHCVTPVSKRSAWDSTPHITTPIISNSRPTGNLI